MLVGKEVEEGRNNVTGSQGKIVDANCLNCFWADVEIHVQKRAEQKKAHVVLRKKKPK